VFENILCTILTGRVYNITIEALHLILTVTLILVGGFIHMRKKDDLPECDVATTVSIIGNKWKLLIIRNLISRPWRFNELQRDLKGISQKVLTDSLRSMEADGIITRTVYPEVPPRVEYALNELGESLCPVIDEMKKWGLMYKKLAG
jgi:DNA-binding HxlR family transcriptional regulator